MTKIFLTGITGFIGSNIAPKLVEKGYEVYALVRYVSNRKNSFPKKIKVLNGNLIDFQVLKGYIEQIKPEIVLHLAAQSAVRESFAHPYECYESNFFGTVNLVQANMNNPNLEKFIFAGTSEEYGNQDSFPIKEDAELRPNQPYAISKVAADMHLQYLYQAYNFPVCIVRPFNTYGRTENFGFVTESIIRQMMTSDKVYLGRKEPVRDLMYVDDHVEGYMKVIEAKVFPKTVNICTGIGYTIEELANKIAEKLDYKGEIFWNKTLYRPTEIFKLVGDNTLAKETLGWTPKYSLDEGLEKTIKKVKVKINDR